MVDEFATFGGDGSDSVGETEFFGLGNSLVGAKGGADFPTETNFAEDDSAFVEFATGGGGGDGETDGEIGSGILDL